jgi:CRISPR-associated protein Cmr2
MDYWKRKLAAYLHDPPSKALEVRSHSDRSDAAFRQAGFIDSEIGAYFKAADHTAAAADRLPFPQSRASGLTCSFDGVRNTFLHPLGDGAGHPLPLKFHSEFKSVEQGFDGEGSVQPVLSSDSLDALPDDDHRWRARFFAHWRLWPRNAAQWDYRTAFLPADTRIPDHSIWSHMQVVSALSGCAGEDDSLRPAFLKVQLGPVQDFIAAARSIRDLWSGSYLLSWLVAAGLRALSAEIGPDAVVFPNLREQPLFDLHWRDELWSNVSISDQGSVWDSLGWKNLDLLTPNLPNVFLAVVPANRAAKLGAMVAEAIQGEWKAIAKAVWESCESAGLTADEGDMTAERRKERFYAQIDRFISVAWNVAPWPESLDDALALANGFDSDSPVGTARNRVAKVIKMATEDLPKEHRDGRYYVDGEAGPKVRLNNVGLGWSVILAFNNWALDAVRQTRDFHAAATGGWQAGVFNNKDALTGREEAVAGGSKWTERSERAGGWWPALFKKGDWLGAPTLVKRVWHRAYLAERWGLKTGKDDFQMPDTRGIACHKPFIEGVDDDDENEGAKASERYFAVLAFDGDRIGEWVSGRITPPFRSQLAGYEDGSGIQRFGARPYFENLGLVGFLDANRPLSPSYHLQFSEALGNFALLCARPIVEAFDGRLIYAGGDDVLALLPADFALECAAALRTAFRGGETKVTGPPKLLHVI